MAEPYPLRWLRTTAGYVWAMVSLLFFVPFGLVTLPFDRRQRVHDVLSVVWAKGILASGSVRVTVRGLEHVKPDERYVVVSNHQSLLDTMIMLVALQPVTPVRLVAKRSLFKVPLLGWGMRAFGHMAVDHKSMRASLQGLQKAQESVKSRWSTIIFAEGTRSPDGQMLPFHSAAFHIAARAGARILPVSISGSHRILPKQFLVGRDKGEVTVTIHPPFGPTGTSLEEVRAATDQVRAVIAAGLPAAAAT